MVFWVGTTRCDVYIFVGCLETTPPPKKGDFGQTKSDLW